MGLDLLDQDRPNGNTLFLDSSLSNIYQLAPGATRPTPLMHAAKTGESSNGSTLEPSGTYWNAAIAINANNTLYVTDRYGAAVHFLRIPYDATKGTWTPSAAANWATAPAVTVNNVSTAVQPQDLQIGDDGTFYVSWSTTGEIDKFTVDSNGNAQNVEPIITGLQAIATNLAVDHAGNLFFIENAYGTTSSRVLGVREIPAGTKGLVGDSTGSLESGFPRIDQGLDSVKGIMFDAAGNLYLSLASNSTYGGNVSGVIMIPNEGTPKAPKLVWDDLAMISPVYAGLPVAVDPRGYLWIPTGGAPGPGLRRAPPRRAATPPATIRSTQPAPLRRLCFGPWAAQMWERRRWERRARPSRFTTASGCKA